MLSPLRLAGAPRCPAAGPARRGSLNQRTARRHVLAGFVVRGRGVACRTVLPGSADRPASAGGPTARGATAAHARRRGRLPLRPIRAANGTGQRRCLTFYTRDRSAGRQRAGPTLARRGSAVAHRRRTRRRRPCRARHRPGPRSRRADRARRGTPDLDAVAQQPARRRPRRRDPAWTMGRCWPRTSRSLDSCSPTCTTSGWTGTPSRRS